jgi:hypothetical protein
MLKAYLTIIFSVFVHMYLKTIILSVVLYGCQTWSVILKEELRLRVFENRVLRRIFGKLHNEELHKLYSSPSIIRMIKSRRT